MTLVPAVAACHGGESSMVATNITAWQQSAIDIVATYDIVSPMDISFS